MRRQSITSARRACQTCETGRQAATEGSIASYIHTGGKIGAMVEVNCETDFVAQDG